MRKETFDFPDARCHVISETTVLGRRPLWESIGDFQRTTIHSPILPQERLPLQISRKRGWICNHP